MFPVQVLGAGWRQLCRTRALCPTGCHSSSQSGSSTSWRWPLGAPAPISNPLRASPSRGNENSFAHPVPNLQQFRKSGMRLSLLLHPAAPRSRGGSSEGLSPGEGQRGPWEGGENQEDPWDTEGNCFLPEGGRCKPPRAGRSRCAAPHPPTLGAPGSLFIRNKRI